MSKIYITCLHLGHGGIEKAISAMANMFCKQNRAVEILCTYKLGEPAYHLDPEVKVTYLTDTRPNKEEIHKAMKSRNLIALFSEGVRALRILKDKKRTLKKAILDIRSGTIISTRHEHTLLLSRYGHEGVRKIAQLHQDHYFSKKLIDDFRNRYANIDYFALLTDQLTEEVRGFMSEANARTQVVTIGNFLEESYGQPIPKKEKQVVAVGRLHPDKGFERMIDIWSKVSPQVPEWKLKIIGEGALREILTTKVRGLHLEDSVSFAGVMSHDKVLDEMAKSSAYLMTSHSESFGIVLIEALSCALPVIAYDVRVGPRAIIRHGKDGFLVADNDHEEFEKAILSLMRDEKLRETMSMEAMNHSEDFMKDRVMERWMEIVGPEVE